jgi:hypothetical protein
MLIDGVTGGGGGSPPPLFEQDAANSNAVREAGMGSRRMVERFFIVKCET